VAQLEQSPCRVSYLNRSRMGLIRKDQGSASLEGGLGELPPVYLGPRQGYKSRSWSGSGS